MVANIHSVQKVERELYIYVASDYCATGEGRTVSLLITRAYPRKEDYLVEPRFDFETGYHPGELKTTPSKIALREFYELFGDWYSHGAEVLTKEEFFHRYDCMTPVIVKNLINTDDPPGNFNWYTQGHYNFS